MTRTTIPLAETVDHASRLEADFLAGAPAGLSLWEQQKLRWALHAGLRLASWVMRYAG